MKTQFCCVLVLSLFGLATLAEEAKIIVREIDIKGATGLEPGKVKVPKVITTDAELAKAITDAGVLAEVRKAVDFEKEKLVLFAWQGSGRDELTHTMEKGDKSDKEIVTFHYLAGRTRDLRSHQKLFAFAKSADFVVSLAR